MIVIFWISGKPHTGSCYCWCQSHLHVIKHFSVLSHCTSMINTLLQAFTYILVLLWWWNTGVNKSLSICGCIVNSIRLTRWWYHINILHFQRSILHFYFLSTDHETIQRAFSNFSMFRKDYGPCNIFKRRGFQLSPVSQNHLDSQRSCSTTLCSKQGQQLIQTRLLRAVSSWVLKICKDKDPRNSLGSLFQCLITFKGKLFSLVRISHISICGLCLSFSHNAP